MKQLGQFIEFISPWFFQASSFQLLKLENLLRWSFFTFIYSRSSKMNYFIYTSHHFTPHRRYELNKLTSLPMCGFIAQLVEHHTGNAEVTGSNPVEALIFSGFFFYCDDYSSLSSTTAVQKSIISYILHKNCNFERRGVGREVDSFVLCSYYPSWVQCLSNFVADCSSLNLKRSHLICCEMR